MVWYGSDRLGSGQGMARRGQAGRGSVPKFIEKDYIMVSIAEVVNTLKQWRWRY